MAGLTLTHLNNLLTSRPDYELEGIAAEFLEAFDPDAPLEEEDLFEWMASSGRERYPRDVLSAAQEAIRLGWVVETAEGLMLTEDGKKRACEVTRAAKENSAA